MTDESWLITRKAMAYDLCNIIDENSAQETYTKKEIKKLICAYIKTSEGEPPEKSV